MSHRSGLVWGVAAGESAVMGAERLVRVDHTPGPSPSVMTSVIG